METVLWIIVIVLFILDVAFTIYLWRISSRQKIGINLNEWQYPVKEFSKADGDLEMRLRGLECVGNLDISKKIWNKTTSVVDEILTTLLQEMRLEAQQYEGLVLDGYRKQGSAREGLKIRAPDEFDVLLEYRIKGLRVKAKPLIDFGVSYPDLGKMKILNAGHEVETKFTTWLRKGIIVLHKRKYFLNARTLHQTVFESIIDKCRGKITNITKQDLPFQLMRSMNPPSINITIKRLKRNIGIWKRFVSWLLRKPKIPKIIDIDIVPAMILSKEEARGPNGFMQCPRYAVVKWMDGSQPSASRFEDPDMLWRLCISGYEKHYMDLARNDKGKRHIMTACRVVKTFMDKEQEKWQEGNRPLFISTFIRSYYLKNIAFNCMLFAKSVKGVHEALGYFLGFFKLSLKDENLWQFFRGNTFLQADFPACAEGSQINLLKDVPQGTFIQARSSFRAVLDQFSGMYDIEAFKSTSTWKSRTFYEPNHNQTCSII